MAKGIEKIIEKFCVQTAVYWGNPVNDDFGRFTFAPPIDIKCRWEDKTETDIGWTSTGFPGNLRLSKSQLLVTQDLEIKGYLWRGTLAEAQSLYPDKINTPEKIPGSYQIHRFDRIPMVFKKDEFVRTVYLYDQGK